MKRAALLTTFWLGFQISGFSGPVSYEDRLLDAICRQENSRHYPYGIKDGHPHTVREARELCRATVRHAYADWLVTHRAQPIAFLDFLADRYCPPQCDAPGNAHWKHNLPRLLAARD